MYIIIINLRFLLKKNENFIIFDIFFIINVFIRINFESTQTTKTQNM
jgi:hypothetical protein